MGLFDTPARDYRGARLRDFDPRRDMPGVVLGYDLGLAGTTLADGAGIYKTPDLGALGIDLIQATTANQPTKQTDATLGLPVMRFTSTGQRMGSRASGQAWQTTDNYIEPLPQPITIFAALKASSSIASSSALVYVFGGEDVAVTTLGALTSSAAAGATTLASNTSYAAGTRLLVGTPSNTAPLATEEVVVASVSGASSPYTLTLAAPTRLAYASGARLSNYPSAVYGKGGGAQMCIEGSNSRSIYGDVGDSSRLSSNGVNICDDAWHLVTVQYDGTQAAKFIDGHLVSITGNVTGRDGLKQLILGNNSSGAAGTQFLGDIGAVWAASGRKVPAATIDAMHSWLAARWGISNVGKTARAANFEDTTSSNGQAVRVFTPPKLSTPRVGIYWSHPHSQTQQWVPTYTFYALAHAAMQQGWVLGASNMHGDQWGNATAQADLVDLHTLLNGRHTFDHVIAVGGSMGGLPSLNCAAAGTISNLRGVYLIDGVCDLANMHGNASYTSSIRTAYGIAGDGSDYSTKTSGFDPMLKAASAFPAIRYRFLSSTADTAVPPAQHATAMAAKLATRSPAPLEYGIKTHLVGHLQGGAVDPADFVAFVKRCIGA